MAEEVAPVLAAEQADILGVTPARFRITTYGIAAGSGIASMAMNFWVPLLPLYMEQLGSGSRAAALFWTALANVVLGIARIVSGPLWGLFSDRFGRKPMFIRTLLCASITIVLVGAARAPWQVVAAFVVQGLLSGFTPAATALMSVSVPEGRLSGSLGLVTGGQYLGTTIGPALGAALVVAFGFRGSMFLGAGLPIVAALIVLVLVPRDRVAASMPRPREEPAAQSMRAMSWVSAFPAQFYVAVFLFFLLFAMNQFVRLLTPLVLQDIAGKERATGIVGVVFSVGGLAAVLGIVFIGQRYVRPGRLRRSLFIGALVAAITGVLLSTTHAVPEYILLFSIFSLLVAMMIPATNTVIATNVVRDRRGTAFGIASSAQALALMVGPVAAAAFGAASIRLGFIAGGGVFLGIAALAAVAIREPRIEGTPNASS